MYQGFLEVKANVSTKNSKMLILLVIGTHKWYNKPILVILRKSVDNKRKNMPEP